MIATFADDVANLSALLGRDFRHWLTSDPAASQSQSIDRDSFAISTVVGRA
jgi:hypothetical protein